MKAFCLPAFVAVVCAGMVLAQGRPVARPIPLEELQNRSVMGRLGLTLGTVAEVDATVVSGSALRIKGYDSLYLLDVTHVDGVRLKEPARMRFSVSGFKSVGVASDHFALYELKRGEKARRLDSAQIAELEKGYVGRRVRLAVYEVGGFRGVPEKLPDDVPVWADMSFRFTTSLVELAERDVGKAKGGD